MIRLIEVKNYRSLKYISQSLNNFQVLVGANATGKSTFLDVISFIADIVKYGIDKAIETRSANFQDLTFSGCGGNIELAIEVELPTSIKSQFSGSQFDRIRYEIRIGLIAEINELGIIEEKASLLNSEQIQYDSIQRELFPSQLLEPNSIFIKKYPSKICRLVVKKKEGGNDSFYNELSKPGDRGWMPSFKLGIKKTALGNLPADEQKFPAATWLKDFLIDGIQLFILNSQKIRESSPPGQSSIFKTDGSNLPWVIEELKKNKAKFNLWIEHIKTALPDIKNIEIIEREDIRHKYLVISYLSGIKVPSWLISDGTLRLLALTIPAYLSNFTGVYLIEEPENGIHPKAVETVFQSLSSVYNAQILLASHSPILLAMVNPQDVLCFAKNADGSTDIVSGNQHPLLKNWQGDINVSQLFSSGILG